MFGWIERIFTWGVANIGGTVVGWVRDFIHGLYGFLHTAFGNVKGAWADLRADVGHFWGAIDEFGREIWRAFWHVVHKIIPDVIRWLLRQIVHVERFAQYILRWAVAKAEWLLGKIESEIAFVIRWARDNIWIPLSRGLAEAWAWITTDGKTLWYFLTHPDKLIDLLWDNLIGKLEQEAWHIGRRLGQFFLGLVLHNAKRFALLLEDIITALI